MDVLSSEQIYSTCGTDEGAAFVTAKQGYMQRLAAEICLVGTSLQKAPAKCPISVFV
jgi:hypothetical protein